MKKEKRFDLKTCLLWIIFLFVLFHLLKDVSQDILNIKSPFDALGSINEDASALPGPISFAFTNIFPWMSYIIELFLVISIPVIISGKKLRKLERWIWIAIIALAAYFFACFLLAPTSTLLHRR